MILRLEDSFVGFTILARHLCNGVKRDFIPAIRQNTIAVDHINHRYFDATQSERWTCLFGLSQRERQSDTLRYRLEAVDAYILNCLDSRDIERIRQRVAN